MFQKALKVAAQFTWPVTLCVRRFDGTLKCGLATLTVVNKDGWFITAHHVLADYFAGLNQIQEVTAHQAQRLAVESDSALSRKAKNKKLFALNKVSPLAVTNISLWLGRDGVSAVNIGSIPEIDLAWGQLQPFDPSWIATYPTFKNPDMNFGPGASLCKLGFPLHETTPTFDTAKGTFALAPNALPPPFPNEGIFTRTLLPPGTPTPRSYPLWYLETSSPGLRGQSGGPIFDTEGRIWAMQAKTAHYDLGFDTSVKQFLNAGVGPHVKSIISALGEAGIVVDISKN